jgi:hypothetical protein
MSDEPIFIGCSKVNEVDDPYPGSEVTTCAHCGAAIWVSPASMKKIVGEGATPCCVGCLIAMAEGKPIGLMPETVAEVLAWMKRN